MIRISLAVALLSATVISAHAQTTTDPATTPNPLILTPPATPDTPPATTPDTTVKSPVTPDTTAKTPPAATPDTTAKTPAPTPDTTVKTPVAPDTTAKTPTGTVDANAPLPGANSFTEAQVRSRLEANGFSNVAGLAKDDKGIWRGTATFQGKSTGVAVDYRGNIVRN